MYNGGSGRALVRAEASIEAARLLASGRFHNFAVSRAYYAMLYAAEALLLEEGLACQRGVSPTRSTLVSGDADF